MMAEQRTISAVTRRLDYETFAYVTIVRSGWRNLVTCIYECGQDESWETELLSRRAAEAKYGVDLAELFKETT
jgi:hypothetical protein